jgi:putative hydrolase of the HAD superfamily
VLVDLDGTLIDGRDWHETLDALDRACASRGGAPAAVSAAMAARLDAAWSAEPISGELRRLGFAMSDGLWATFSGDDPALAPIRAWAPEFRAQFWAGVSAAPGVGGALSADELAVRYVEERLARVRAFVGASTALQALRRRFRTVLVSNGTSDLQRHKLLVTGMVAGFDAIVISGEVGCAKPDARMFEIALAAAGCSPAEAIMVGDDWGNDVLAALGAGVGAVFLDPKRSEGAVQRARRAGCVAVLDRFTDLPDWLEED